MTSVNAAASASSTTSPASSSSSSSDAVIMVGGLAMPPESVLAQLRAGAECTLHMSTFSATSPSPTTTSTRVFLFFRDTSTSYGRSGSLFWTPPSTPPSLTELDTHKLPLHLLTDLRSGKLTTVFQSPACATLPDACCLSLTAARLSCEWNLSFATPHARELWWRGIVYKLHTTGRQFKTPADATSSSTPPSRTASVSAPGGAAPSTTTPTPTSPTNGAQHSSSLSLSTVGMPLSRLDTADSSSFDPQSSHTPSSPRALHRLTSTGSFFRKYDVNTSDAQEASSSSSSPIIDNVFLWIEGQGRTGTIFWTLAQPPATPAATSASTDPSAAAPPAPFEHPPSSSLPAHQQLALADITDFMIGKKSSPLQHSTKDDDSCFSIMSSRVDLHLEASDAVMCKRWQDGLMLMLMNASGASGANGSNTNGTDSDSRSTNSSSSRSNSDASDDSSPESSPSTNGSTGAGGNLSDDGSTGNSEHVPVLTPSAISAATTSTTSSLANLDTSSSSGASSTRSASPSSPGSSTPGSIIPGSVTPGSSTPGVLSPSSTSSSGVPSLSTTTPTTSAAAASTAAATPPATSPLDPDEAALQAGQLYTLYYVTSKGEQATAKINLFFVEHTSPTDLPGSLYWCASGNRVQVDGQRLPLSTVKQMVMGYEQVTFATAVQQLSANSPTPVAPAECCFSIVAKHLVLNLEAPTNAIRDTWMRGLHRIMTRYAAMVKERKKQMHKSSSSTSSSSSGSLSLNSSLTSSLNASLPAAASAAASMSSATADETSTSASAGSTANGAAASASATVAPPAAAASAPTASATAASAAAAPVATTAAATAAAAAAAAANIIPYAFHDDHLRQLKDGSPFVLYFATPTGAIETRPIHLFVVETGPLAPPGSASATPAAPAKPKSSRHMYSIFWCAPGTRVEADSNRLHLSQVVRMIAGKDATTFQSALAQSVPASQCLSIIGKTTSLHLQAGAPELRELWMNCLHVLIVGLAKHQSQLSQSAGAVSSPPSTSSLSPSLSSSSSSSSSSVSSASSSSSSSSSALSAAATPSPSASPSSTPSSQSSPSPAQSPASAPAPTPSPSSQPAQPASTSAAVASASSSSSSPSPAASPTPSTNSLAAAFAAEPEVAFLSQIHPFLLYYLTSPTVFASVPISLFLDFSADGMPHLYWCPQGSRAKSDGNKIPFARIAQVGAGKDTPAFRLPTAAHLAADRCLFVLCGNVTLSLETPTPEQRTSWLTNIERLRQKFASSYRALLTAPKPAGAAAAAGAAGAGAAAPATGNGASAARQAAASPKHPLDSRTAAHVLSAGQNFNLLFTNEQGVDVKVPLFFFFQPSTGADEPGALLWCPQGQRVQLQRQRFPLNTVKQMKSGKETAVFRSAMAASIPENRCLSIFSPTVVLNLEAPTPEIRTLWMQALHTVLVDRGMRVVSDPTNRAGAGASPAGGAVAGAQPSSSPASSAAAAAAAPGAVGGAAASRPASAATVGVGAAAVASDPSQVGAPRPLANTTVASHISSTINFSDPTEFFSLLAKIGEGSYGSVYKALDHRDNTNVAIKVIPFSGKDSRKLRKEIKTLQGCHSPFIVDYKGAFQRQDNVWIVMEYCAAGSVSDMMQTCKRTLSEQEVACVMRSALSGLAYLHSQGKIHRDIKGGNILTDSQGICKLADFGVSGNLDKTLGKHRTVIGTPHWMAPEVLMSDDYNELADIWSLGITAYELAIGEPPHATLHSMRAALKIPMCPPPTLPDPEHWSPEFHSFLAACLIKDFHKRPSAAQLLHHPFILKAPPPTALRAMIDTSIRAIEEKSVQLEKAQQLQQAQQQQAQQLQQQQQQQPMAAAMAMAPVVASNVPIAMAAGAAGAGEDDDEPGV